MDDVERKKILLVSNLPAPYRRPIFLGLLHQKRYEFKFYFYDKRGDERWERESEVASSHSLKCLLFDYRPDVVICGGYGIYALLLLFYKICLGKKMLIWSAETVDSEAFRQKHRSVRKILRAPMFRFVDGWLAYGPPAYDYLVRQRVSPARIRVVNNPSDMVWHDVGERVSARDEVLSVIRMVEQKKPYAIVELAKLAARRYPGLKFTVVGDGPLLPGFRKLVDDYELDNIRSIERVDRDRIYGYYLQASMLLHIPIYDQWPHAINEAMVCGLPIICTDKCGIPTDLVEDGVNGFVVDNYDYSDILDKINYLVKNEQVNLRYGIMSRRKSKNINCNETVKEIIRMLDGIYDEREL